MAMTPEDLRSLLDRNLPEVDQRGEIIEEIGADWLRVRLPVIDSYVSHDFPPGSGQNLLSGPILLGFAETSLYACIHAFYGANVLAVTLNFNASFLRAARATDLVAEVRMPKRGREIAFVEATVWSAGQDQACALVSASYSVRAVKG